MDTTIQTVARRREAECMVESRALELLLRPLRRWNWGTVLLPALITAFAGSEMIAGTSSVGWRYGVGLAVLGASLLVIVHKALNCDAYQADAHRLRRGYEALAIRYRTISDLNPPDAETTMIALDESLATLKESAEVAVRDRYRLKAQALIDRDPAGTPKAVSL